RAVSGGRHVLDGAGPGAPVRRAPRRDRCRARAARARGKASAVRGDRRPPWPLRRVDLMTRARVSLDAFTEAARKALAALHSLSPDTWVVGGALRDALMGRPAGDLDVAVPADALALGRD